MGKSVKITVSSGNCGEGAVIYSKLNRVFFAIQLSFFFFAVQVQFNSYMLLLCMNSVFLLSGQITIIC